jgi:hypothetical protein
MKCCLSQLGQMPQRPPQLYNASTLKQLTLAMNIDQRFPVQQSLSFFDVPQSGDASQFSSRSSRRTALTAWT